MNNLRIGESRSVRIAATRVPTSSLPQNRAPWDRSSEDPVPPTPARASIARFKAIEAKIRAYANYSHH